MVAWADTYSGCEPCCIRLKKGSPATLNGFLYAAANPLRFTDPSGKFCIGLTFGAQASVGGRGPISASFAGSGGPTVCVDGRAGLSVGFIHTGGGFVKSPWLNVDSPGGGPSGARGVFGGAGRSFFSSNAWELELAEVPQPPARATHDRADSPARRAHETDLVGPRDDSDRHRRRTATNIHSVRSGTVWRTPIVNQPSEDS